MPILTPLYRRFIALKKRGKILFVAVLLLGLWFVFCLPCPLFDVPYSTLVADRKGELLGARTASDGQWRFPPSDSVPDKYAECVIAFEDRHFRHHLGVNPLSMGRAIRQNIKARRVVSGGSTLTMQTVRLMRKNKRTYLEKIIEMILATRLECSHSKNRIIALYASHAPMGGNMVGIDAASWRYFGHSPSSLSWAEAATLAVLPNSPSMMHFGRNRQALTDKRNRLLKYLSDKKILGETDYALAVSEPLPAYPHALPQIAPHLVTRIFLQQPGSHALSTIDKGLQEQTDEVLSRWNAEFAQNGIFNMSALIVDLQSNEVLAYCGNVNFNRKTEANQVDIIQASRSTGSILKPLLYCAMQQEGSLLPIELLPDVPINLGGFAPKNFSLQYDGAVPANEALARSLNVPAVIALRRYGVQKFHQLLQKGGLTTLNKPAEHYGLSLILGGAEGKLWEVAEVYAEMVRSVNDYNASGGYFAPESFCLLKSEGKGDRKKTAEPLFQAGAAWLTLEALTNVNRPEEIDWQFIPSMRKVAWKTGTSYGFRDAWAIGVTPRYLVAVWTGNASGEGRPGLTGARTSAQVMFDLFNLLPATSWFQPPYGDLAEAVVCRESGCLRGINCPETSIDTLLVSPKAVRGSVCGYHKRVHVSDDGRFRVYEECAGNRGITPVAWFVLPPSQEWYFKQQHPNYRSLPPFSPECLAGASGQIMQFIYPFPNAAIKLTKQLDGSQGKVIFELAHRNSSVKVFWHLDEDYVGETSDIHQMAFSPAQGKHRVTVVDESGNSLAIGFRIE
ncbi:MAG: penicillin-binding protein 1C [Dysgonamonadaceae bacterium]|jgi:penicillin-binding protein 1C|nr:penicillin-binding protein 1C [Dysgonamonadaceae bacterium]